MVGIQATTSPNVMLIGATEALGASSLLPAVAGDVSPPWASVGLELHSPWRPTAGALSQDNIGT